VRGGYDFRCLSLKSPQSQRGAGKNDVTCVIKYFLHKKQKIKYFTWNSSGVPGKPGMEAWFAGFKGIWISSVMWFM
jgi:hypothetical protein